MIRKALLFVILLAAPSAQSAEVKFAETPVPTNSFAEAIVQLAPAESVVWMVVPEPKKMVEIGSQLFFNGPPGEYSVTAIIQSIEGTGATAKVKTVKVKAKITLGGTVPPPPDAFLTDLNAAFKAETDPTKTVSTQKLAAIYKVAGEKTSQDPKITTYGQLFDTMKVASVTLLPETAIQKVRRVVGDRLNATMSAASTPIDRVKVANEFKIIAEALNGLK